MPEIVFVYEGVEYTVGTDVCTWDRIELPDGRLLAVDSWTPSHPPEPRGLHTINRLPNGSTRHFARAALAKIVPALNKEKLLRKLEERRANPPKHTDNVSLPAGSLMYYYCKICGWLADTLPEWWHEYPPNQLCPECKKLKNLGLIEE